jgi:hypothetical protein
VFYGLSDILDFFLGSRVCVLHVHPINIVIGASFKSHFDSIMVSTSSYIIISK